VVLTEMLREVLGEPESLPEKRATEAELRAIKNVIKDWIQEVGLPTYHSFDRDGKRFDATGSLRVLLVNLVDEPEGGVNEV